MTAGSFVRLGYYFAKQLLLRLFRRDSGLLRFERSYGKDRLLPLLPAERTALKAFSGCIACGLCDAHFDAYAKTSRRDFPGPSALPLSYSRSLPDYEGLEAYLDDLEKGDLVHLERICPSRVPFRALAAFTRRHAAAMKAAAAVAAKDAQGA